MATWWFGLLAATALVAATYYMRAEPLADKRAREREIRKAKRREEQKVCKTHRMIVYFMHVCLTEMDSYDLTAVCVFFYYRMSMSS